MRSLWIPFVFLVGCPPRSDEGADAPDPVGEAPAVAVDPSDPETCAACHGAVVAEWRESMHARAHHDADPLYGTMRARRMAREGEELGARCGGCHTPLAPTEPESAAARVGVACGVCHGAAAVDTSGGKKGAAALEMHPDGTLTGPHDVASGSGAPHGVGPAAPHLVDGETICLACHDATANPRGVAACTTGPEARSVTGGVPCTACHMPEVDGPSGAVSTRERHRSHAFLGPHRAWYQDDPSFLAGAVDVSGRFDGDRLRITLVNRAQHAFPTGFPGRWAALSAVGRDAEGREVWDGTDPDTGGPIDGGVFAKVYVDADGKPTMPPYAARLERDTRLAPGETRELEVRIPPEVVAVDLAVTYRLGPPRLFEVLELADAAEAAPRTAGRVTVTR